MSVKHGVPVVLLNVLITATLSCKFNSIGPSENSSGLSSFNIGNFAPGAGNPAWSSVAVNMQRLDGNKAPVSQTFPSSAFQNGSAQNVTLKIPQGTYTINLTYTNASNTTIYTECTAAHSKSYAINTAQYSAQIPVCAVGSNVPVATVPVSQMSDVTITPILNTNNSSSGGQTNPGQTNPTVNIAACSNGLAQNLVAFNSATTQYPQSGSLSQLPSLSASASAADIKQFISTVYSTFPIFAQIYETQLGLSKQQALAYMFGDMSRESGGNVSGGGVSFRMDLETGNGGPGHAWGPFQAAVTNFQGGGYDSSIEDFSGLPIPSISQFKDPAVSTYAGMKRLADGILNSVKAFGGGQPAQKYLLGSLADHNTGYPSSANDQNWLSGYGNEVLRLMIGYLQSDNLTNNKVYWTGESAGDWSCQ